ncbi:hypothetical protein ICN48_07280 [Polynucleobacter sp. JS-Safj-400b-B2]|uniref:hypothetical protein n=1 Tax=Polynucleobacter sp. JS-Safj-400b-B2 TaxID=2576921 RepID=UPI001C0AE0BD|nr:hypothetical protein [Polynucleobacter sp. JS-Safj-400b-B2]MBU3626034.1 hypothetical protein [Polynucleobacter sp. JS-Safj-400b-B2]
MAALLWWFGVNLIIAGAYSTAVTAAGIVLAGDFMKSLQKRIEATDGISWDIEINRIKVGETADNQYATIVLSNFSNSRVLWAQFFNGLRMIICSINFFALAIAILTFWFFVALAYFYPEEALRILTQFAEASPAELPRLIFNFLSLILNAVLIAFIFLLPINLSRFGFINHIRHANGLALRQYCNCAADGLITLSRNSGDRTIRRSVYGPLL